MTTVRKYDLPRCPPGPTTPEEIVRIRAINSRVSNVEGEWFQSRDEGRGPDCWEAPVPDFRSVTPCPQCEHVFE